MLRIHKKMKHEMNSKKEEIEQYILRAEDAYLARSKAEEELKIMQVNAEKQKKEFEEEYNELNKNIEYDRSFKAFIKDKEKEKETLRQLEECRFFKIIC